MPPLTNLGRRAKLLGSARAGDWRLNPQQRWGTPIHLSPPVPSLPHELKPRMSPFLQVTWVCQSSRTQWYRGCGLPANSRSSSVDMRRHEVHMRGRHLSPTPRPPFSWRVHKLPVARELSSSVLSPGSMPLALARCHRIFLARVSCPVASSQRGDSGNRAGNLEGWLRMMSASSPQG